MNYNEQYFISKSGATMARRRDYYRSERGYNDGYSSPRRYSYRRRERRREERQVEIASFGMLIILFAVGLLTGQITPDLITLIGGAILLGSAVYQWQRRWRVNPTTWIGGAIMVVVGIVGIKQHYVPGGMLFPIAVFALVIVASLISGEF
jgi:hypothetical protein